MVLILLFPDIIILFEPISTTVDQKAAVQEELNLRC